MLKLLKNICLAYASSFLSIVLTLLIARAVGAERFADFAAGIALGGVLAVLAGIGSQRTFVKSAVRVPAEVVPAIASQSFSRRFSLFLLLSSAAIFLVPLLLGEHLENSAVTIIVALWAGLLGLYPQSWFDYERRSHSQLYVVLAERSISVVAVVALLATDQPGGVLLIALVLLAARALSLSAQVALWHSYRAADFKLRLVNPLQHAPGTSAYVMIPLFSNSLLTYGLQLFLLQYYENAEMSSYSIAFTLMSIAIVFQGQLLRVLNRNISDAAAVAGQSILSNVLIYSSWMMVGSAAVGFVVYFFAPLIPWVLNDEGYSGIQTFLLPLIGWVIVIGAGKIITQHLIEVGEEKFYMWNGVCGAVVALSLAAYFVPTYGGLGVATILLFVRLLMTISNFVRLHFANASRLT